MLTYIGGLTVAAALLFFNGYITLHLLPRLRYKTVWKKYLLSIQWHGNCGCRYTVGIKAEDLWLGILFPIQFTSGSDLWSFELYIDDGRILNYGDYDELFSKSSIWFQFWSYVFGIPKFILSLVLTPLVFIIIRVFKFGGSVAGKFLKSLTTKAKPLTKEIIKAEVTGRASRVEVLEPMPNGSSELLLTQSPAESTWMSAGVTDEPNRVTVDQLFADADKAHVN